MRNEALNHKFTYGAPVQGSRVVLDLADMHKECTQSYVRRPYGVGMLIAVSDQTGPHLYLTEPSGNFYEYVAMAIGSRSQTSRTYLEREYESFELCSKDDLIKHSLRALNASLSGESTLDCSCVSLAVVGVDQAFEFIEGAALQQYLDLIEANEMVVVEGDEAIEIPEI